eukprot:9471524-Pyramimonas_sp.AAC.2
MPADVGQLVEALWVDLNDRHGVGTDDALGSDGGPVHWLVGRVAPVPVEDVEEALSVHLAADLTRGFVSAHVEGGAPTIWGLHSGGAPSTTRKPQGTGQSHGARSTCTTVALDVGEEALGGDSAANHFDELRAGLRGDNPVLESSAGSGARDHALAVGREEERVCLSVVLGELGEVGGAEPAIGEGEARANLVDLLPQPGIVALHLLLPTFDLVDVVRLRSQALWKRGDVVGHLLHEGRLGGSRRGLAELVHVGNRGIHALLNETKKVLLEVAPRGINAQAVGGQGQAVARGGGSGSRPAMGGGATDGGASGACSAGLAGEGGHGFHGGDVLAGEEGLARCSPGIADLKGISLGTRVHWAARCGGAARVQGSSLWRSRRRSRGGSSRGGRRRAFGSSGAMSAPPLVPARRARRRD